jgi:hypothetical protein
MYEIPTEVPPDSVIGYLYKDLGLNIVRTLQMLQEINGNSLQDKGLRVEVNPDGTFNIVDFTLPSSAGRLRKNIPQEGMPKHVIEAMAMLQIAEQGSHVKGIGFRLSDSLYYVSDNWGET